MIPLFAFAISESEWHEKNSEHFIVRYVSLDDESLSGEFIRAAEHYYDRLGGLIGYKRYDSFWTWDDRAIIFIYPDKKKFMSDTGQPEWSLGGSTNDEVHFKKRVIITYAQADEFIYGVLPHEITHLVLKDFIKDGKSIPVWFQEGLAQLQETKKMDEVYKILPQRVNAGQYIPFSIVNNIDIYKEKDKNVVGIFYAQALTMVDYMVKTYGEDKFAYLCRGIRDGAGFDESLRRAYPEINNMEDFEKKWLSYMKTF
ncbi:MAG: hypothetical protein HQL25_09030 [Candidatus Omnitrophica bacterium]|nr:hypothetical protein [Candidatus Omnitrophota bacterium]